MVRIRDEGGVFDAPREEVWAFFTSGRRHSAAHHHRAVHRRPLDDRSGIYEWVQTFRGRPTRFAMRWTEFRLLGWAYEVLEGPFAGSRFLLCYIPEGSRTRVIVEGEFRSPTIPSDQLEREVRGFFDVEFEEDRRAIAAFRRAGRDHGPGAARSATSPRRPPRGRALRRTSRGTRRSSTPPGRTR